MAASIGPPMLMFATMGCDGLAVLRAATSSIAATMSADSHDPPSSHTRNEWIGAPGATPTTPPFPSMAAAVPAVCVP